MDRGAIPADDGPDGDDEAAYAPAARRLVDELRRGIGDSRVLAAVATVPRERFVPRRLRHDAYRNSALPIACEQTISQPLVVARMCELLELAPSDRVLEVGTGSGYHAAVLARLVAHVWTVERHAELSRRAEGALQATGVENVTLVVGDGARGLAEQAPFDAISVTAAARDRLPTELLEQLAEGGRLVAPIGRDQRLVRVRRTAEGFVRHDFERVRFVPLIPDDEPGG